jgi:hypothetical protein
MGNKLIFSCELSWMKQEGFFEVVAKEWASISGGLMRWIDGKTKYVI